MSANDLPFARIRRPDAVEDCHHDVLVTVPIEVGWSGMCRGRQRVLRDKTLGMPRSVVLSMQPMDRVPDRIADKQFRLTITVQIAHGDVGNQGTVDGRQDLWATVEERRARSQPRAQRGRATSRPARLTSTPKATGMRTAVASRNAGSQFLFLESAWGGGTSESIWPSHLWARTDRGEVRRSEGLNGPPPTDVPLGCLRRRLRPFPASCGVLWPLVDYATAELTTRAPSANIRRTTPM